MTDSVFKHNRFARKVLWLFVVCAVVPVLGISVYAFRDLTKVVDQQLQTELGNTARGVGQGVLERLQLADSRLASIDQVSSNHADEMFSQIIVYPDHQSPAQFGKRLAVVKGDGSIWPGILLRRHDDNRLVEGTVSRNYMQAIGTMVPFGSQFCALTMRNQLLFCHGENAERLVNSDLRLDGQSGFSKIDIAGQQFAIAHWDLFLQASFGADSWRMVVFRNRSEMLEQYMFIRLFPLFSALALAIALILSLTQIRRGMRPMQQLLEATTRIGRQDFSKPVVIDSRDEFEQLGRSFNRMSSKLRQQFGRLQMFTRLDQRILESGRKGELDEWVLQRLDQLIEFTSAALVVTQSGGTIVSSISSGQTAINSPQRLPELLPDWLGSTTPVSLKKLPANECSIVQLTWLTSQPGVEQISLVPIVQGDESLALLAIGFADRDRQDAATETLLELRDRLAVAFSSVRREQVLFNQAHYDQLTQLPNRSLFVDRLEHELARARHHGSKFAVMFIDLDRFKTINDSLGHSLGDRLLIEVASRIANSLSKTDTAARMGGDEFMILQPDLKSEHDATMLADRIMAALRPKFTISGHHVFVSGSIGVTVSPADGEDAETLMRNADAAMYQAKESGGAAVAYYSERLSGRALRRLGVETRIRSAVETDSFELHYQPQFAAQSGQICGVEALIRLADGVAPPVSPAEFIPIAEQSGLIQSIGLWTLNTACRLLADLSRERVALDKLAINVSPIQLRTRGFADAVREMVDRHGVDLSTLAIEITETALVDDMATTRETLNELAAMGCQIVLDDFGTGHSSLAYLQQFPIHVLKLDRTFVNRLVEAKADRALVRAIITLSHNLGKPVIAEGVETAEQLDLLNSMGCEMIQGYHLSKPLPETQFTQLLRRQHLMAV